MNVVGLQNKLARQHGLGPCRAGFRTYGQTSRRYLLPKLLQLFRRRSRNLVGESFEAKPSDQGALRHGCHLGEPQKATVRPDSASPAAAIRADQDRGQPEDDYPAMCRHVAQPRGEQVVDKDGRRAWQDRIGRTDADAHIGCARLG